MADVCGHQHPGYEHTCTFPKGHDRVMPEDCELPEELMDHGDPAGGAWWSVSPAVMSSSPDIPDEAVEAALASLAQHQYDVEDSVPWMRRALAAAYPALTRQAVADAWDEGRESGISDEQQAHRRWTPTPNPYRADTTEVTP